MLPCVLDALDRRGQNLNSLSADVKWTETDPALAVSFTRGGKFWLENRPDGSSRAHALFTRREDGNRVKEEKIEYLLDGPKLIDRNYQRKTQVTRIVLRPGEKMNLLKLGEGPFPLPIGQKREDVYKSFDATKADPSKDDPPGTVHVRLVPKPGTSLANKFKTIDVWVNLEQQLPQRITTLSKNETTEQTTELSNLRLNAGVNDADFQLQPIDDKWQLVEEAFQDGRDR